MDIRWHISIGLIFSLLLIYSFDLSPVSGLIIFLSSFLIDVDHYFWYSISYKDWNPIHAIRWCQRANKKFKTMTQKEKDKFKKGIFIFHGIIFLGVLLSLSFFYNFFFWIFLGVSLHLSVDWLYLLFNGEDLFPKIFPLLTIRRNKNKKSLNEL